MQSQHDPDDEDHRHKVRLLGCVTALLLIIILAGVATCALALVFGEAEGEAWRVLPPSDPQVSAAVVRGPGRGPQ